MMKKAARSIILPQSYVSRSMYSRGRLALCLSFTNFFWRVYYDCSVFAQSPLLDSSRFRRHWLVDFIRVVRHALCLFAIAASAV